MNSSARVRLRLWVAAAACLVVLGAAAPGQEVRIQGRVVDPSGEPLAGVTITLLDLDRNQSVQIDSGNDGTFFRRGLQLARYRIEFRKDGYVTLVEERRLGFGDNRMEVVMEPAAPEAPPGPAESPEYAAGFEAFQAGRYQRAVELLEPLAVEHPDFPSVLLLLGRSHLELAQWEQAAAAYRRTLELEPDHALAHLDLGVALVEMGDLDAAAPHLEAALELRPEEAEVHYNVGTVYFQAGEVKRAVVHLRQALELEPDHALAHKALAFALVRQERLPEAAEHLGRYLQLEPEAPDAAAMRDLLEELRRQSPPGSGDMPGAG